MKLNINYVKETNACDLWSHLSSFIFSQWTASLNIIVAAQPFFSREGPHRPVQNLTFPLSKDPFMLGPLVEASCHPYKTHPMALTPINFTNSEFFFVHNLLPFKTNLFNLQVSSSSSPLCLQT